MRHKDTIELFNYWNEIRDGAAAPPRSALQPAALGRLLPSIMLLDGKDAGETVFRLAGSKVCALRCAELKGEPFEHLFLESNRPWLMKILASVQRNNGLVVLDINAIRPGGASVTMEVALFPIVDESTRILGIASTFSHPEWLGAVPVALELGGVRYLNPDADLAFLQSRPSIPVLRRSMDRNRTPQSGLHLIAGKGKNGPARAIRAFRVVEGGKK